jgi:hypothetical protein
MSDEERAVHVKRARDHDRISFVIDDMLSDENLDVNLRGVLEGFRSILGAI